MKENSPGPKAWYLIAEEDSSYSYREVHGPFISKESAEKYIGIVEAIFIKEGTKAASVIAHEMTADEAMETGEGLFPPKAAW